MQHSTALPDKKGVKIPLGYVQGILLTFVLAVLAQSLSGYPFLSIMGQLVIAILLGMIWKVVMGVNTSALPGIAFSSKKLLRVGIILLGMRLNLTDFVSSGPKIFVIVILNIVFAIIVVYWLSRLLQVDKTLGLLNACGTGICGASAVVAIASQIKAKDELTAISAVTVSILGTIFTIAYTFLYPIMGLTPDQYGIFSGATLHEIGHVLAAAAPAGNDALNIAIVVKLIRVALLVGVAIAAGIWASRREAGDTEKRSFASLPIPWFIFGFLAVSALHSSGIIPEALAAQIVFTAYMLIAMAMAGIGLNVEVKMFKQYGAKAFLSALIGSVLLSVLGYVEIFLFGLQ